MAVNTDALTTLANLKSVVGIASADTSKDTYLEQCINRATWEIESRTGRKFNEGLNGGFKARRYNAGSSTHTTTAIADEDQIYFSGSQRQLGGDTLVDERGYGVYYLPVCPVQANTVVTFALEVLTDRSSAGETWDATVHTENQTFVVDRPLGILRLLGGAFVPGIRNYRITCAAGYAYGSAQPYVPPDLEALCLELAKGILRDNRTLASEQIGTWQRSYDTSKADPLVDGTFAKYSRFLI